MIKYQDELAKRECFQNKNILAVMFLIEYLVTYWAIGYWLNVFIKFEKKF